MSSIDLGISRWWPSWLNAMALLLASVIGVATLSFQARPDADIVAVAAIVRTTAVPSLLVVRPDGRDGLSRLYQAGAWLALDPQAIAACLGRPNEFAK
jgi:hypothetical protein